MWGYRRPGFEAHLLAELQEQQRHSQHCDTVLRAEGVSVPVHGCILSALSPKLSRALSSRPPPPPGQSHRLEFTAFGACALLKLVGLLYSGEVVGEGEVERKEVLAAAAELGINGLVEVGKEEAENEARRGKRSAGSSWTEGERWKERATLMEMGVQTEPLDDREAHGARLKAGECEIDGGAANITWRHGGMETPADTNTDTGTQSCHATMDCSLLPLRLQPQRMEGPVSPRAVPEQSQVPIHYPFTSTLNPNLVVSYADDVTAFQAMETLAPGSVTLPTDIPLYNSSALLPQGKSTEPTHVYIIPASLSSSIPSISLSGHVTEALPLFTSEPPQTLGLGIENLGEGEEFERFKGNIPGFIRHFLNPDQLQEEGQKGRWGRRKRVVGGASRGVEKKEARRHRSRSTGRPKGGVETGETAPSKEQAVVEVSQGGRLQRWGMWASRAGQGGCVVGRKVHLKSREMLQPIKIQLKKRHGQDNVWEITRTGERKGQSPQRIATMATIHNKPQLNQECFPVIKKQRGRPRLRPIPFPKLPTKLYKALTYEPPSSSLTPSSLLPHVAPAPALLHTAPLPPPPQVESVEQFEWLEDIMMGLNILPNVSATAQSISHLQGNATTSPLPAFPLHGNLDHTDGNSDNRTSDITATMAAPHTAFPVAETRVSSGTSRFGCDGPVLQQVAEGDLSDILDHFLRSIEQHVAGSNLALGEMEDTHSNTQTDCRNTDSLSDPYTAIRNYIAAQPKHAQPASAALRTGKPLYFRVEEKTVKEERRMTRRQTRERIRILEETGGVERLPPPLCELPSSHTNSTKPLSNHTQTTKPPSSHTKSTKPPASYTKSTKPPANHTKSTKPPSSHTKSTKPPPSHTKSTKPPSSHTKSTKPLSNHTKSTKLPLSHTQSTKPLSSHTKSTKPPSSHTQSAKPCSSSTKSTKPPFNHTKSTKPSFSHTKSTKPSFSHTKSTKHPLSDTQSTKPLSSHTQSTKLPSNRTKSSKPPSNHTQSTKPPYSHTQSAKPCSSSTKSTKPPFNHTQSTKPSFSHTKSTKSPSSHTQSSNPHNSRTKSFKPPNSHMQPRKLNANRQTVQTILKPPSAQPMSRRGVNQDQTRRLVKKSKQLIIKKRPKMPKHIRACDTGLDMCLSVEKLKCCATECMVNLEKTQVVVETEAQEGPPPSAKQPTGSSEKDSVPTVQPLRKSEEDLKMDGDKNYQRFSRRSEVRSTSAQFLDAGLNRRENRWRKGEEKRAILESEIGKPKRKKGEETEGESVMGGGVRQTTCPGLPEQLPDPATSGPQLPSSQELQLPDPATSGPQHPSSSELQLPDPATSEPQSPSLDKYVSGKEWTITVEMDEEVDVIQVAEIERIRETVFRPRVKEKVEERRERGMKRRISSEEDIDVVELDSDGSVDVVGEGFGQRMEWDGGIRRQSSLANKCKALALLHSGTVCPTISLSTQEHMGSTGSWEEEEEEVDVLGGSSPLSVPSFTLPGLWEEGLRCEDEEEDEEESEEEIDIIGV